MLHALGHRLGGDAEKVGACIGDLIGGVFEVMRLVGGMRRQDAEQRPRDRRSRSKSHQSGDEFLAVHIRSFPSWVISSAQKRLKRITGPTAPNLDADWGFFTGQFGLGLRQ